MQGIILIIDDYDFAAYEGDLIALGMEEGFDEFAIAYASNLDEAYEIFFNTLPALIIANAKTENGKENLEMLKTEEMYRHIPVLLLTEKYDLSYYHNLYKAGADAVLTYNEVKQGMLATRVRPMLAASALFQLKIIRGSELQEKALKDFILLDLIKPYVPLTIWEIAQERAQEQKMEIKEQQLELTMAFGDVKGFTHISQKLEPAEVIHFLNVSYEVVTRHVYENGGDIDKFIGDAFFAVFKSAKLAIKSMAGIQRELAGINSQRSKNNEEKVQFRIAVHSGPVIRGNVGGHNRFDNTLIGDTVNTASRLEHEAPIGGLLVSREAAEKAGYNIPMEKMISLELRGRDALTYAFSYFDMVEAGYIKE